MAQMATNKDIDIVYVVTPNALHMEHALAAAAAGKHVFCEKPLEISVERCQQMIDACKKAGMQLGVGYRLQFEPNHLECVRLAKEKVLGDVKIIDANFGFAIGDPDAVAPEARRSRAAARSWTWASTACRPRACSPAKIRSGSSATEVKTDAVKFKEVDETILWQTKFPSGVVSHMRLHLLRPMASTGFRAATTRGWFGLEPAYFYNGNRGRRSDGTEINIPGRRPVRDGARGLRRLHHQQAADEGVRARWACRTSSS